jgi:glycolate oxidase subunit GlcD
VLNGALAEQAKAHGLFYAPDPASRDISSIGGNIATNAGGACCMKYGTTGDHVAALRVALADGSVVKTGALTRKNVAGLDLTRLIVGSEGTLGVIVEATVRLLPAPKPSATLVAHFPSLQAAGRAVLALEAVHPLSLLELMDQTTLRAVEAWKPLGLDTESAALLIAQSDAPDAAVGIEQCERVCRAHGASDTLRTDDPAEGSLLLTARRLSLPALERLGMTLLDDVAVPKPALPALIERIAAISQARELIIGTFGHAGDGNLHPTIVFAADDDASRARAFAAFDDIVHATLELGGTLTGEHGVGTLKTPYLSAMVGPAERELMARIKAAFDPRGILNPGKAI